MKETRIMKAFEQYIKNFDMNKGNVKAMYFHSLKMMELCKDRNCCMWSNRIIS